MASNAKSIHMVASDCTGDHKRSSEDPNDRTAKWGCTDFGDVATSVTNEKVTWDTVDDGK